MSKKRSRHPKAWAFKYRDGSLDGYTMQVSRPRLVPEARMVRVRIVPETTYRAMRKAWRESR